MQERCWFKWPTLLFNSPFSKCQRSCIFIQWDGSVLLLRDSQILDSFSFLKGSAVRIEQQSFVKIINCTKSGHSCSENGGAVSKDTGASVSIENSYLSSNTAENGRGAISSEFATLKVLSTLFYVNVASEAERGALNLLNYTCIINYSNFTVIQPIPKGMEIDTYQVVWYVSFNFWYIFWSW